MKRYLWQNKDGDKMHGFFASIPLALADAFKPWNTPKTRGRMRSREVWVWNTRAARKSDAPLFKNAEDTITGDATDTTKPGWWSGYRVPTEIVRKELLP